MKNIILFITIISSIYSQDSTYSEELKYYPLQDGNYFEYLNVSWELPYPSDSSAHSITVLGDTTLENGKKYKILLNKEIFPNSYTYYIYERIDSSDGSVYRYMNDELFSENEYKIDSLFAQPGDTINCSRDGFSSFGYIKTVCNSVRTDTVLGLVTEVKEFYDQSYIPGLDYELANGLGLIGSLSCEFGCGTSTLVYAEINDEKYGQTITSVGSNGIIKPKMFFLYQNYPNPFNPTTKIKFTMPNVEDAKFASITTKLVVYDILGREIATLINEYLKPGNYEIEFNAKGLSSGIYYYKIESGNYSDTKKMILLK